MDNNSNLGTTQAGNNQLNTPVSLTAYAASSEQTALCEAVRSTMIGIAAPEPDTVGRNTNPLIATPLTVTTARSATGNPCTKTVRFGTDGKLRFDDFRAGTIFHFNVVHVPSTLAVAQGWATLPPHMFFVHGTPRVPQGRRTHVPQNASLYDAPTRALWIDVDTVPLPDGMDALHIASQAIYVRSLLPAPFHAASCAAGGSTKAGLPDAEGMIKLRLFFALDVPAHIATIKQWLRAEGAPVDLSIYTPSQPIYSAAPVFEGVADPFVATGKRRVVYVPGAETVHVPAEYRGHHETLQAALDKIVARIRDTEDRPNQNRSNVLWGISKDVGKLAPHHVTEDFARGFVMSEVERCWAGYVVENSLKAEQTIARGVAAGMCEPVHLRLRKLQFIEHMGSDVQLADAYWADTGGELRYLPTAKIWLLRGVFGDWTALPQGAKPVEAFKSWSEQRADAAATRALTTMTEANKEDRDKEVKRVRGPWLQLGASARSRAVLGTLEQMPRAQIAAVTFNAAVSEPTVEIVGDGNERAALPLWPLRTDFEPKFSHDVDTWLRTLAGERYEYVEDWIACLPFTSESVPALYLYGKNEAGKSVFAAACARLWDHDATPAKAKKIFQKFNSELRRTPLVFSDEGLPINPETRMPATTLFREIIEARAHAIEPKGGEVVSIHGCVRMIIAENSEEARSLRAEGGYEVHDIAAVEQRIIAIPVAGTLSRELGQRFAGTDEAAAHVLWIVQQRAGNVVPGRMRCRSYAGDLVRRAATQAGRQAILYDHIARALLEPYRQWSTNKIWRSTSGEASAWIDRTSEPGVRVLDGQVLVNAASIAEQWQLVGAFDRKPASVAKDLRLITTPEEPRTREPGAICGGTRRLYKNLDLDKFREWATESGLHLEDLQAAIGKNTTGPEHKAPEPAGLSPGSVLVIPPAAGVTSPR